MDKVLSIKAVSYGMSFMMICMKSTDLLVLSNFETISIIYDNYISNGINYVNKIMKSMISLAESALSSVLFHMESSFIVSSK